MALKDLVAALLGISTYQAPASKLPSLDDKAVEDMRERFGGQLSPLPTTKTRWYLAELEGATVHIGGADEFDDSDVVVLERLADKLEAAAASLERVA